MPRRNHRAPLNSLYVLLLLLTITAVIVDDPARWSSGYRVFRHAEWDGVLPADLVTPVFLFFLGAAIPLSHRVLRPSAVLAGALILVIVGLAIDGLWRPDFATWRVTGVLQRAGVAVGIAAMLNAIATGDHRRRIALLGSIAAVITLTYWLVMAHVPVPDGVAGDLSLEGNFAAWVDRVVLGSHAWSGQWDPDGILSTLSSVSTVLAGIVAGIALTSDFRGRPPAVYLLASGGSAVVAGILWSPMVPINRSLWSASFVVLSAGVGGILLGAWKWSQRRGRRERRS